MLSIKKNNILGQVFIYLTFFVSVFFIGKNQLQKATVLAADDLVLRINGSALQKDQKEIYTYKWTQGELEKYFYYSQRPSQTINGITATPFLLWTHSVFITMSYCDIKFIWLFIELFFLFVSGLLLLNATNKFWNQFPILIGFILFFASSPNWLVQIESGQVYIVFAFVFCLYYWIDKKDLKNKKNYQSVLLSLAILLRPIFIISVLYFLLKKDFAMIKKGIVSFLVIGITTTFLFPISNWNDYRNSIKEYSKEVINEISIPINIIPNQEPNKPIECLNKPTQRIYNAGGLYTAQKYLQNMGIKTSNMLVFLSFYLISIFFLFIQQKSNWLTLDCEQHMVLFFLFYLLFELCTPTVRNPYNLIQWLAPALLILSSWRIHFYASTIMLAGLLLNQHLLFVFKYSREIGEILMITSSCLFIWLKPKNASLNRFIFFLKSN